MAAGGRQVPIGANAGDGELSKVDDEEQELGPVENCGEARALRLHPLLREQLHKLVVQYLLTTKSRELLSTKKKREQRAAASPENLHT
jgi:hypothetical protein